MNINNKISTSEFIKNFSLQFFKYKNDNTKLIITTPKCGTRYLQYLTQINTEFTSFQPAEFTKDKIEDYFNNLTEIYWIVRPPMEHVISAIMTEHQDIMQNLENPNKTSSKLKIKKNDDNWTLNVLEMLIEDISTEPYFSINRNNLINGLFGHYKPTYKKLYNEVSNRIDIFSKITFVELSNLTNIIKSEFKIYLNINQQNYAMDTYFSKEKLLSILESNFKDNWDRLKLIIYDEKKYYDLLLKIDYDILLNERIDAIYNELETLIPTYTKYKVKKVKKTIQNIKSILV
jgi:hypothetical protein